MAAWVGKEVTVFLTGESDPWHGVLQDWDERGVILHHDDKAMRFGQEPGGTDDERPHKPILILFPWAQVRLVGIFPDDL